MRAQDRKRSDDWIVFAILAGYFGFVGLALYVVVHFLIKWW